MGHEESIQQKRYARVLIATSLPQFNEPLTYSIPEGMQTDIRFGCRVKVPLRNRVHNGFVVGISQSSDFRGEHQPISELISPVPVLDPDVFRIAQQLSERFVGNIHDILRLTIPTRQVRVEKSWWTDHHGDFDTENEAGWQSDISENLTDTTIGSHEKLPMLALEIGDRDKLYRPETRLIWQPTAGNQDGPLWAKEIVDFAASLVGFGQSVILALPDFRDIQAIEHEITSRADEAIPYVRSDSDQSNKERYQQFLESLRPNPTIILGNRSAVLSPAHNLGAILVWEESDPSHIEPMSPYHSTRDAAVLRATSQKCRLIFAGHSTSYALERLQDIHWLERIRSRIKRPKIIVPQSIDAIRGFRIPEEIIRTMQSTLKNSSCLIQVAKPTRAEENFPDDRLPTVSETAKHFGKSFPGAKIVIAEGDTVVTEIEQPQTIVVATRGAEPIYRDGYGMVALLDAGRMIENEEFSIIEDSLRSWYAAAAQAALNGSIYISGLPHKLEQAFALWQPEKYIIEDLPFRKQLNLPPYVRLLSIRGARSAVWEAIAELKSVIAKSSPTYEAEEIILQPKSPEDEVEVLLKLDFTIAPKILNTLREFVLHFSSGPMKQRKRFRVRFHDTGRGVFE